MLNNQPVYGGVQNQARLTETARLKQEHQQKMYVLYLELVEIGAWDRLHPATQAFFKLSNKSLEKTNAN